MVGRVSINLCRVLALCLMVVGARADAAVFSSTELSKGDWRSLGYSFELSLGSRISTLRGAGTLFAHGLQLSPSYQVVGGLRIGLDFGYQFFIEPVPGVANAFRLWAGWNPRDWYQGILGIGWAQERRVIDIATGTVPEWARGCELGQLPHIFQRQHLFVEESGSFRWGPSFDAMGGYGRCRNENREHQGRWMWAAQLLFSFAWR